ncbi:S-layer homology domain-containing protein [Bacillus sp. FJAT-28004]|uniref:S-layer homology domain-containing protein n=1 Tax=Bacillus sp. FJAT-28004 TaxID=1679165 RepID=UPI0006B454C2|nr:S-layer homology domain-containing protein [Bacillus sp. FJAT-28004]
MKKNFRKLIALTIAVTVLASAQVAAAAAAFTDTKTPDVDITFKDIMSVPWAMQSIKKVALEGIMNGYIDGTFKPKNQMTKAELVKTIAIAFEISPKPKEGDKPASPWYAPYKNDMVNAGVFVAGDLNSDLNKPATRTDLSVLIVRALDSTYRGKKVSKNELVFRAVNLGILSRTGSTAESYQPEGTTTRAQVAVVLDRVLGLKEGKKLTVDKGASSAAEIAWHKHNFITRFNQNDLVTFPHRINIRSNYDVIIDQLIVLDPSDANEYMSEYLKGMQYNLGGRESNNKEGYLFAYKLIGKNLTADANYYQTVRKSFYMFIEADRGEAYLADKFNYLDGKTIERKGLFRNRENMSFAKKGNSGHDYLLMYVDKKYVDNVVKSKGALPIHLEKFGPMSKSSQFYLTGAKDLYAL